jgi:hypothetical protein
VARERFGRCWSMVITFQLDRKNKNKRSVVHGDYSY